MKKRLTIWKKKKEHFEVLLHLYESQDLKLAHKQINSILQSENITKEYIEAMIFYEKEINKWKSIKINALIDSYHSNNDPPINDKTRSEIIFEKLNTENLLPDECEFIKKLCEHFPNEFHLEGDKARSTSVAEYKIRLIDENKITNSRPYRIPEAHKKALAEVLEDHEKQGIIEKCDYSPFNIPIILLRKKDLTGSISDKWRLVLDFRALNRNTIEEPWPMPRIQDILNSLGGSNYFSLLDLKGAFFQIRMAEDSKNYTAFTANNFRYRFIRMPFGLSNSPRRWQSTINTIFREYLGKGVQCYLDDVVVFHKVKQGHNELLWKVLNLIKENNLQLKISKCTFFARHFEYLGYIIDQGKTYPNPKKIEITKRFPRPLTVKNIMSFLGMAGYFRMYVPNFSGIVKPLTMLKKDVPFVWTHTQQEAFDKLKEALATRVMLNLLDWDSLFYLTTDASYYAIGAMLSQITPTGERPIYFYSKTLNEAQRRYSVIELELLAVVESIKAFKLYLYGRTFVVVSGQKL